MEFRDTPSPAIEPCTVFSAARFRECQIAKVSAEPRNTSDLILAQGGAGFTVIGPNADYRAGGINLRCPFCERVRSAADRWRILAEWLRSRYGMVGTGKSVAS
jgi:hypothetical protein